jgi:hypothetical protein
MICIEGFCQANSGQDGNDDSDGGLDGDADGDSGGDGLDSREWSHCLENDACPDDLICFNDYCVDLIESPGCKQGEQDSCGDDRFCEPTIGGCLPWEVHPYPKPECEYIPPAGEFVPSEEWIWQAPLEAAEWDQVMMTPVVVDLSGRVGGDFLAVPAVIFNSFRGDQYTQEGILRAITGDSGAPIFSVTNPDHYTHPASNIAVGDIDNDGLPEIVTAKSGGTDLICFESDGSFKWETAGAQLFIGWGGPAIANLDNQGLPEIVVGAAVVDALGNILWQKHAGTGDNTASTAGPFSVPYDVDGDGDLEIVTGRTLYDHLGNIIWDLPSYGDGFVAVADFNETHKDPVERTSPEIVVVSNGMVRVQKSTISEPGSELLWVKSAEQLNLLDECQPNCGFLGPPTVADFDNDGQPEIGVAGADVYIVLDTWGEILWSVPTRDASSNITGSAVFDFEGDGAAEVVYADEESLKVFNGADGRVLYQQAHSSLTTCEYPVIVDVDADRNAEIVIAQNAIVSGVDPLFHGIRAFGDTKDNWVATRRIWNQHAYYVTAVNENGTIPDNPQMNYKMAGLNNFRQNIQGQGVFAAPDMTARAAGYDTSHCQGSDGYITIYAEVANRGSQEIMPGVPVSFYLGNPAIDGTLLGTEYTTQLLWPGELEVIVFTWQQPPQNELVDIYVIADDQGWDADQNSPSGSNNECREQNNIGITEGIICRPPI